MDIYHGWCDLKPGVKDTDFARALAAYLNHRMQFGDDAPIDRNALHVTVDGQEVPHSQVHFVRSDLFEIGPVVQGSFIDELGGPVIEPGAVLSANKSVGYYVVLDDLRDIHPGPATDYVIQFNDKGATVTDYVHIV